MNDYDDPDYFLNEPEYAERACLSCGVEGCECDSFCVNCGAKIYGANATGCHAHCGD